MLLSLQMGLNLIFVLRTSLHLKTPFSTALTMISRPTMTSLITELADDEFQDVEFLDDEFTNISTLPLLTCDDILSTEDEFVLIDKSNAPFMPEDDDFVMLEPTLPPLACPVSPNFEPT